MRPPNGVILAALMLLSAAAAGQGEEFFASRVFEFSPGVGYELFPDPQLAVGGPVGGGWTFGGLDVVSLGVRGELVLGFVPGQRLTDGDGADLIVFENAFGVGSSRWAELVRVGVSTNGLDYVFFPAFCGIGEPVAAYEPIDPSLVAGFAGVGPVLANVGPPAEGGNGVDPFDPDAAGGDAFDLADLADDPLVVAGAVDLTRIYFVKLVDVLGDGTEQDSDGSVVYDPTGNMAPPYNDETSADIDALSIIHGLPAPVGGDANEDGAVNGADYTAWADHYGLTGMTWAQGDFDGNIFVDGSDYTTWADHYGYGGSAPPAGGGGGVPEPASIVLWLVAAAAGRCKRRPRQRT